jgi:hypothetical protein
MGWKAFLCLVLFLEGARVNAQDTVKIGEVNPISGAIGEYGASCHKGIQLAIDLVNASGGVLGKRVDLLTEDNQSKAGQTSTIVRKFVTQDKVVAIVGDLTSSATLEGGPIAPEIGFTSPIFTVSCALTRALARNSTKQRNAFQPIDSDTLPSPGRGGQVQRSGFGVSGSGFRVRGARLAFRRFRACTRLFSYVAAAFSCKVQRSRRRNAER